MIMLITLMYAQTDQLTYQLTKQLLFYARFIYHQCRQEDHRERLVLKQLLLFYAGSLVELEEDSYVLLDYIVDNFGGSSPQLALRFMHHQAQRTSWVGYSDLRGSLIDISSRLSTAEDLVLLFTTLRNLILN